MSTTADSIQVTFTGELAGLPPFGAATVINVSGGGTLPGTPVALPGSTLPANYKWADRSVALFADWPDLKTVYDAGLLDVLPANATDADKAAQPRKWVLNSCGTGLLLPDIGGRFARDWRPGQADDAGREAGTRQGDAIRNIVAGWTVGWWRAGYLPTVRTSGAVSTENETAAQVGISGTTTSHDPYAVKFDASRVVPTAGENRPLNDAQPVAIYMGRRAKDMP